MNSTTDRTQRARECCRSCLTWCNSGSIMVAFKGIWTKDFWRAVSAEYLATLIFVFLGVGSTINWHAGKDNPPPADLVLISLCFGLSIATMVQCFGHISGGHINPAVTAAMVVTRKLSLAKAVFYVVAQCLGAITGAGVLYMVTPRAVRGSFGVSDVNADISVGHGLLVEIIITFELVFTVFATCDPKRSDLGGSAALAIGVAVAIGHLFGLHKTFSMCDPECVAQVHTHMHNFIGGLYRLATVLQGPGTHRANARTGKCGLPACITRIPAELKLFV